MNKEYFIKELKKIDSSANLELISKYVDFCISHDTENENTQRHHILPQSLFKHLKGFKEKWNIVKLSNDDHYVAHSLLAEIFNTNVSVLSAWYAMNNCNFFCVSDTLKLIGKELYDKNINARNKMVSKNAKGKVTAKNLKTGETLRVTQEEFYLNDDLVGATKGKNSDHLKGKITVFDKIENVYKLIKKEEFDENIHIFSRSGKANFKNSKGKIFKNVNVNDPRVLNGELVGVNKGRKFSHGDKIRECKKNTSIYKDKDGKVFNVRKNDPRVLSGELVGVNKGRKFEKRIRKIYKLFDNLNNLVYTANDSYDFISFCRKIKFPYSNIQKLSKENRLKTFKKNNLKYNDWYVEIIRFNGEKN